MSKLIRKQVYLTADQNQLLKRRAAELGVTESDILRRGIELAGRAETWLTPDAGAWQAELTFLHEREQMPPLNRLRTWTREELYDARPSRIPD